MRTTWLHAPFLGDVQAASTSNLVDSAVRGDPQRRAVPEESTRISFRSSAGRPDPLEPLESR
ncbi:hypothetical protein EYF80_031510 [Liparis tanakae]|uniref:Uncharacterized protein n=1 Tax=Liparis tanakae TaxID=230148 RepID=A0A4Z2GYC6_9TELE|nr:hypothetical protein EYF80_031510 [Liparis tanakae]